MKQSGSHRNFIAELFGVEVNTINYHLKEIFKSGELSEEAVIRKNRITASDGKNYNTNFYNLDVISDAKVIHYAHNSNHPRQVKPVGEGFGFVLYLYSEIVCVFLFSQTPMKPYFNSIKISYKFSAELRKS